MRMLQTRTPSWVASSSESLTAPRTLDELSELPLEALHSLYLGARTPQLAAIRGHLRGRMLRTTFLGRGRLARTISRWASTERFPWRGKSFIPPDSTRGEGDNRVVVDALHLYRFRTFIGRSKAGDFNAVQLDYDLPDNPFFIRAIKDEVRQLASGILLGQAHIRLAGEAKLALYFALEER